MAFTRNKIPCSADRLGLLDPQMIQAVVEASAFQIGKQYLSENRVRIVEADGAQITAAVIGNSGLYEQTIRLKDGHLISKCSCTIPEEPICRHCVAVLLEYHRWSQPRQPRKSPAASDTKPPSPPQPTGNGQGKTVPASPSSVDVKLSEVMLFIEWLQPAMAAIEKGQALPSSPEITAGEVATWIHTIRNLEERRLDSEALQINLEADLRDREAYVGRLTQQLQTSLAEARTAQTTAQDLQREVATHKELIAKVGELADEVSRYDGQLKSMAQEFLSKGSQLDKLAGSYRSLTEALKSIAKPIS
ncbi:SWIM zinc finger family protein [Nitrospira sp. NS4]|uniref:SWIM zinc finger family protein n=1 Tax=Nitrospira sp. NS4 TaxID=3414498 RepID=UPI003C2EBBAE